jgi:magnesium chelatase family protein
MAVATPASVARMTSCALWGLEAAVVTVEVDVANGLPAFSIVGLPDAAVSEAKERVRAAVRNSGFEFPLRRVVANLAPAERKKEGTGFELAIALGVLRATGQLKQDVNAVCLGELALDGSVRAVRGVMPRVRGAIGAGVTDVICAEENAAEAAAAGAYAIGVGTLAQAVAHISGAAPRAPTAIPPPAPAPRPAVDLADISGHETPKRALEIAAAGGHSVLFVGPPGTGKTLLARALPGLLPPLDAEEAVIASAVHSVAGLVDPARPLLSARPFRAPHHTASHMALVGGASPPRPGEISLAHSGALFLDELPEFSRQVIDTLRQPLEEGAITLSRAAATATYPARVILVAAMNPCPCGHAGDPATPCTCLPDAVERYHSRLSGPFMDRIDIRVHVPRLAYDDLRDEGRETSRVVRERVTAARERMRRRLLPTGRRTNAEMSVSEIRAFCRLDGAGDALAHEAMRSRTLSVRGIHRVMRVARTIADLAAADAIRAEDLALALVLRGGM